MVVILFSLFYVYLAKQIGNNMDFVLCKVFVVCLLVTFTLVI